MLAGGVVTVALGDGMASWPVGRPASRSRSGRAVWPVIAPAGLSCLDLCAGSRRCCSEGLASGFGGRVHDVVDSVVFVELALAPVCHQAEDAYVLVGHDRGLSGSGIGSTLATASGSERGTSSTVKTRKPTVPSRLDGCGGSPHCGQATRYAPAAGVKRSRQGGQQRWIMSVIHLDSLPGRSSPHTATSLQ